MAGQVKHNKIFSSIRPDWKLAKLLLSLPQKKHGFADRRRRPRAGIGRHRTGGLDLISEAAGASTGRADAARAGRARSRGHRLRPGDRAADCGLDLGQTVVIRDRACVAVEAMEGTDETIERAARIAGGGSLVVVKVSKPRQDMRFDVPVVGLKTVEVMRRAACHRAGD